MGSVKFKKNLFRVCFQTTCETILKLMTLGNPLITTCSFEVLHGLFVSSPPTTRLLPTLNAQIIHALYDYQPSNTDTQATLAWLTVMQEAHKTLAKYVKSLKIRSSFLTTIL